MDNERNCGLDLFRLVSMLLITCLHLVVPFFHLLYGDTPRAQYRTGLFIEYACFCGVNGFAMLSGFLASEKASAYNGKWFSKVAFLWVQLLIWSVSIYLLGRWLMPEKTGFIPGCKATFLPVSNSFWWYMTCYFGLLAFMPLLNKALSQFDAKESLGLAAILFAFYSFIPVAKGDVNLFILNDGYAVIWLIICFIFGAVLKKNEVKIMGIKCIKPILVSVAALCVLIPYLRHCFPVFFHAGDDIGRFMTYLSPFCLIEAAALLLLFSSVKIKSCLLRKILPFLSANALGIYLFQCHPFVWNNFFINAGHTVPSLTSLAWQFPAMLVFLAVAGTAINFFISSFCKIIRVKQFAEKLFDASAGRIKDLLKI